MTDGDTLLMQAKPVGLTCHTGADTCKQRIKLIMGLSHLRNYPNPKRKADSEKLRSFFIPIESIKLQKVEEQKL
jgi:hypothetical protein